MYIFTFTHPHHPVNRFSEHYGSRNNIHNDRGVFQREYLRTKIKKENYEIVNGKESSIHNIISNIGICNIPLYGIWLTTTDSDLALMFRLGIEDYMNPKTKFKFSGGYVIDDIDSFESKLKKYNHEIVNMRRIKSRCDQDVYQCKVLGSFHGSINTSISRIHDENIKDMSIKFRNQIDFNILKSLNDLSADNITRISKDIDNKINEVEDFISSFKMKV